MNGQILFIRKGWLKRQMNNNYFAHAFSVSNKNELYEVITAVQSYFRESFVLYETLTNRKLVKSNGSNETEISGVSGRIFSQKGELRYEEVGDSYKCLLVSNLPDSILNSLNLSYKSISIELGFEQEFYLKSVNALLGETPDKEVKLRVQDYVFKDRIGGSGSFMTHCTI